MLNSDFVEMTCLYYPGRTIVGLAKCLRISPRTIYRIESGLYASDHTYNDDRERIACNRTVPTSAFSTVREAMRQVRARG